MTGFKIAIKKNKTGEDRLLDSLLKEQDWLRPVLR